MLEEIMSAAGIEAFGVADYRDTQPGPEFKRDQLPPTPRSVIVCLFPYDTGTTERNVARYAVGMDYHAVAKKHLEIAAEILRRAFPGEVFVTFVDGSPVAEVRAAVMAGLGVRGKNNQLINEKYGTRCAIGDIVTTMRLEKSQRRMGGCLDCLRCFKACPGHALTEKGFDRTKCVSAISQKKGELTADEAALVAKTGLCWACDRCTDCCPMNHDAGGTGMQEFKDTAIPFASTGMDMTGRAYAWRGAEVVERNLRILENAKTEPHEDPAKRKRSRYDELGGCGA